ncbi:MAG: multidrug efflux RND transporter permease subunit [Proteobacteria bacterium]|nr:multidrug efflux RND transporter permease subunit [Pseudomonadota bacterium]
MKFGHFFIERPIFAAVISILMVLVGGIAYFNLPVAQYPEVAPPTVVVSANYPGADAQTVANTVANPLEAAINGVENMLYMSSYSTSDGAMSLTITFKIGTDLDLAQVQVQNLVNTALPRLPEEVRRLGVNAAKSSPDLMMVIHLVSPDESLDQLYISNYALLRVKDQLTRVEGVGNVRVFGAREYAIRVWLDPERMASLGLTAGDVVGAMRQQNVQVSGGGLGLPPVDGGNAYQFTVTTQGRFETPEQFKDIIVKNDGGKLIRLSDVARVELGAKDYILNSYLNGKQAVAMVIFQRPGSNALATAEALQQKMKELAPNFPKGLEYRIIYNPTEYIAKSIEAVYHTLIEAILLVVLVVLIFLQSWRASIIPIIAIPVSLIGTFAVMAAFGFSLNLLTLFGLVLAIGIVVDDAIVVVENIERHIAEGMTPKEAASRTLDEVGGAVIAIALVLCAVFIPTALIPGLSGQFYKQFAMTIAVATVISAFNSLTLSPALGAMLLRKHEHHEKQGILTKFARGFNSGFDKLGKVYGQGVKIFVRRSVMMLLVYGALVGGTVLMAGKVPSGFIPMQDQGYGIVVIQLPDGAALSRTDEVTRRAMDIMLKTPGVDGAVGFAGLSGATFTNASNAAAIFARFKDYKERTAAGPSQSMFGIIGELQQRLSAIEDAFIIVIPPPPVRGIGNAGGFKMMVKDTSGAGIPALMQSTGELIGAANGTNGLIAVYTTFSAGSPQVYLDIDREKAQMLGIPLPNVFETLQIYLGSAYVNDFNAFGKVYQVTAQADLPFRLKPEDIAKLKTRNAAGEFVPLGTIVKVHETTGPNLIQRYNQATAVAVSGNTMPGFSSGDSIEKMEKLAKEILPQGLDFEWTELALQQKEAGNAALFIFALSVIFVFLVLSAMYESWSLPIAIILIVPMSVLGAFIGVWARGMDNNILTQIGLVVLIGLAAKNAILIVEFARHRQEHGETMMEAVVEACRLRLRPILMTSLAFILGVVPLVIATGPGAEMRQSMGTAVFAGMIGVTIFGLILTPVFYAIVQKLTGRTGPQKPLHATPANDAWAEECSKKKH